MKDLARRAMAETLAHRARVLQALALLASSDRPPFPCASHSPAVDAGGVQAQPATLPRPEAVPAPGATYQP